MITPLIQEVTGLFPQARIDLFVKGNLGQILFKEYSEVDRIIQLPRKPFKNLGAYLSGWLENKKPALRSCYQRCGMHLLREGLSTQFANARYRFFGDIPDNVPLAYADHEHIAKYPVYVCAKTLIRWE